MRNCKHLGKKIGIADARCSGVFNLYQCTILLVPCTAHNIQVHSVQFLDVNRKSPPITINCALCQHNTNTERPQAIPPKC